MKEKIEKLIQSYEDRLEDTRKINQYEIEEEGSDGNFRRGQITVIIDVIADLKSTLGN